MYIYKTNKQGQGIQKGKPMQVVTDIRRKRKGWIQLMAERAQVGVMIPQGFVVGFLLFIIAQTAAAIWWAAKIDTSLNYSTQRLEAQKLENDNKTKALETDLKEIKDKLSVQALTTQLLQVKIGIMEGRKK